MSHEVATPAPAPQPDRQRRHLVEEALPVIEEALELLLRMDGLGAMQALGDMLWKLGYHLGGCEEAETDALEQRVNAIHAHVIASAAPGALP